MTDAQIEAMWLSLETRYKLVQEKYLARFPKTHFPPLPDTPNAAINLIDAYLAPLQGREPTIIRVGDPVIFHDRTPEYPAHPVERKYRGE
jgi:hypothetical protein